MNNISYNENHNPDLIKTLPLFDYTSEYTDSPKDGDYLGIFDVSENEKTLWEEGEEEKVKYRRLFEKRIQHIAKKKQPVISQEILTKLLLISSGAFILSFFIIGSLFIFLSEIKRGYIVANSYGILSVPVKLMSGSLPVLLLVVLLSFFFSYFCWRKYINKISRFDDRKEAKGSNVAYLNYDTKKCQQTFEICEIEKPVGIPLGVYKGMVYCMPDEPKHYQFRNKNLLIIGGSGAGKSYAVVEPLLLQCIAKGESFIVSDTKGALYRELSACCIKMGYDVKMFSTKGFTTSDSWNCLRPIIEASELESWDLIDDFAHTIIKNSRREGQKGEQYWDDNEQDLLRSLLHYVCRSPKYPDNSQRTFSALVDIINGSVESINQRLSGLSPSDSTYAASASFVNLKSMDLKEKYRSGLANKMQIFKNIYVKAALSYDGIDIKESVKRPTAIFLVSPDDKSTYDAITSLFISSCYMKLISIADICENQKLNTPYWLVLDELCNMATINDLSRKISTNRSRNINIALTIQSISQIEERYGKLFENIAANCGTIIPVGTFDDSTARFIANKCGTFSELSFSKMAKKPSFLSKYIIPLEKTERVQVTESKVLSEFSIKNNLNGDILALIAGKELFRGKPYTTDMHPLSKYCTPCNIVDRDPEWFKRLKEERPELSDIKNDKHLPSKHEIMKKKIRYSPDDNMPREKITYSNFEKLLDGNYDKRVIASEKTKDYSLNKSYNNSEIKELGNNELYKDERDDFRYSSYEISELDL